MKWFFPHNWWVHVRVERGGGMDRFGKTRPVRHYLVTWCLIAPGATGDAAPHTHETPASATLYRPHDPPGLPDPYHEPHHLDFEFLPGDTIIVPHNSWMTGRWQVEGRPKNWPIGWEVPLKQAGPASARRYRK